MANVFRIKRSARGFTLLAVRGFTLLEVLVALAILALSSAAILRQTQLSVRQQQQLELKSAALWVADDTLASINSATSWPPVGRIANTVQFHEQGWNVITDVSATPDADLRKIVVSVNLSGADENSSLVSFTTFRGRY
jgi:general secretion pathway protein I